MSPLERAFTSGQIVRPVPQSPNLIHLVRAMLSLAGTPGLDESATTRQLMRRVGPSEHLIFILLDGMGANLLPHLSPNSFLVSHLTECIQAVCPTTTAAALTSVATAQWPTQHGVTGWFTHVPELNMTVLPLPFIERLTQQPLTQRGLRAEDLLPIPAVNRHMPRWQMTLMPEPILNTPYAVYSRGATPGTGYRSISHAVDLIIDMVNSAREPTFLHLYMPDVDTACHRRGIQSSSVTRLLEQVDAEMARLAAAVTPRARMVITADHGLIDVAIADHMPIFAGDPLLELLEAPPSGDARMPLFHVRPNRRLEFVQMFEAQYARGMILVDMEQIERMNLFGPGPFSPVARQRFGNYAAIALRPVTLLYHPPLATTHATREPYIAQHGGMSRDEMEIPLIVA